MYHFVHLYLFHRSDDMTVHNEAAAQKPAGREDFLLVAFRWYGGGERRVDTTLLAIHRAPV